VAHSKAEILVPLDILDRQVAHLLVDVEIRVLGDLKLNLEIGIPARWRMELDAGVFAVNVEIYGRLLYVRLASRFHGVLQPDLRGIAPLDVEISDGHPHVN